MPIAGAAGTGATRLGGPDGGAAPPNTGSIAAESADETLDSGAAHWRGWQLRFNGSRIVDDPESASEADRTFGVWSVDEKGRINSRVAQFTIDANGLATIDTRNFIGRFVVRYGSQPVYVIDGVGYVSSPPDGAEVTVETSTWRTVEQTLTTSLTADEVFSGQVNRLIITSNRSEYTIAASASGVDFETLTSIFPPESYASNYDDRRRQDVILLSGSKRDEYVLNTSVLDPGARSFQFDVTDTEGSSSVTLAVKEDPDQNRIVDLERVEHAGDLVTATVDCGHCYLMLGGPNQGVFDIVELVDENGDGLVNLSINTRYAGMNLEQQNLNTRITPYRAGPDTANRFASDVGVSPPDVRASYALGEVRSDFGVPTGGRTRPVVTGIYDLTIASSRYMDTQVESSDSYRERNYSIRDVRHVQSIRLTEPGLGRITTRIAAQGTSLDGSPDAILAKTAVADRAAIGDQVVVVVEVSGVYGHLLGEHENTLSGIVNNQKEDIAFSIREGGGAASGSNRIDLARSGATLRVDEAHDRLFILLDTRSLKGERPVKAGETYRAVMVLNGMSGSYPYLPDGVSRRTNADVTLVEPQADVSARATRDDRVVITGNSTVAPGSVLTVKTAALGEYSWQRVTGVVVQPDGTWEASVSVRDAPTDEFSVTVTYDGTRMASMDRFVATPPATATPGPGGSGTSPTDSASSPETTGNESASSPTPSSDQSADRSGDGGPSGPDGSSGGVPFAPGIPRITGVLGIVLPVGGLVVILGLIVLAVMG